MIDIPMNTKPAMDLSGNFNAPPVQNTPPTYAAQPIQSQPAYTPPPIQTPQPTYAPQPTANVAPTTQFTPPPARPKGQGVSLAKGQKVSLTKMNPNLDEVAIGLGWDTNPNSAIPYDLDAEAFLVNAQDRIVGDDWFVFYNQPISPDGAVRHGGDNRTGVGQGDDETILVKLSQVSPQVEKIIFVVTINEAKARGHNFGQVANAYIRVVDQQTQAELVRFDLSEYYKEVTSMMVGELYKKGGEWRFNPIGAGKAMDLLELCQFYGVNVN